VEYAGGVRRAHRFVLTFVSTFSHSSHPEGGRLYESRGGSGADSGRWCDFNLVCRVGAVLKCDPLRVEPGRLLSIFDI
jgi:hypothetical protein